LSCPQQFRPIDYHFGIDINFLSPCTKTALRGIHHVAIITADYPQARDFYHRILGLPIVSEVWRAERSSWKLNLALPDGCQLELFSFPAPPARVSRPEACGLRHLALRSELIRRAALLQQGVPCEEIRLDESPTGSFSFARARMTCRLNSMRTDAGG
jgi:glyoxylase I family protein